MYVGRHANQDAVKMQREISMRELQSWAARVNEMLEAENAANKTP